MKNYLQNRNNNHLERTSLFDALDDFFRPVFADEADYLKSNISETDKDYRLEVAVPGFTKEQIKLSLENGYLNVVCSKKEKEGAQNAQQNANAENEKKETSCTDGRKFPSTLRVVSTWARTFRKRTSRRSTKTAFCLW